VVALSVTGCSALLDFDVEPYPDGGDGATIDPSGRRPEQDATAAASSGSSSGAINGGANGGGGGNPGAVDSGGVPSSSGGSSSGAINGGANGSGGGGGNPGAVDSGGVSSSSGGRNSATGGSMGSGGKMGAGGKSGKGGAFGAGGVTSTGGIAASGGSTGSGGRVGTGGAPVGGCTSSKWYLDSDADRFGDDGQTAFACTAPDGRWVLLGGDCDDKNADVHPATSSSQVAFHGTGYANPLGQESFDYDCNGNEDGDPSQQEIDDCSGLLSCDQGVQGYVSRTDRAGSGIDSYCGSTTTVTCGKLLNLLICGEMSRAASQPPRRCR
jgi:hypothetical protein